jgi:predicted DNA-binding WGR domain protein
MENFLPAPGGRQAVHCGHESLRQSRLEKRQFRFYRIIITTLFDPWALIRERRRIGSLGTVREAWYDSEQEAVEAGAALLKQKIKRGYQGIT